MDAGTYTAELADSAYIDTQIEEGYQPVEPVRSYLQFIRVRNSVKEASGGSVSFLFLPDGTREFGTITVVDPDTEEIYTVFLNPYLSEPEILTGDVDFNETYPL
jgi:DNA/RNA endonuclease YhcR with UshA esterase domain